MAGLPRRRFDLVIFDNDGVVVDSEPLAAQAMSETLVAAGYPVTPRECDEWLKGSTLARARALVEGRFQKPLAAGFEGSFTEKLLGLMAGRLKPVPGIEAVLDRLDEAHLAYCLASSGRRRRILFALETAGLAERFAGRWWGAEDVARGKPAPDLFLLAASSMTVEPERCAVVEDSKVGVQAAVAAGMTAFGFAARTPAGDLGTAGAVFKDMAELPGLLLAPGGG
ncbi:MAG: HAD family hydrolase [Acidimicrobiales bacterium]